MPNEVTTRSGHIGPTMGETRAGLVYGISAYTLWGVFPLYFRAVGHVSPWVVLCHRIFWSAMFLGLVIQVRGEWTPIRELLRSRRTLSYLFAGAILIALNWLIFIYSVATRQVLQASLGYFINPLLSIALGTIFLGERLRQLQWLAVAIAGIAVATLTLSGGAFPWVALALAVTFGFYGLVRKKVNVNSLHSLVIESAVLFPFATLILFSVPAARVSAGSWAILSLSGVITAVPLLLFGAALRRLPLSTVGFLQYIGPTLQLLVATVVLREQLDSAKLLSFGLCWIAIGVYILDSIVKRYAQEIADEPE